MLIDMLLDWLIDPDLYVFWCWLMLIDADWWSKKVQPVFFLLECTIRAFPAIFSSASILGGLWLLRCLGRLLSDIYAICVTILPTIATSISGVAKVVRRYYLDTTQFISGRQEASRRAHPPLGGRPRCSPRCRCQQPHPKPGLGGWSSFRHRLSQEDVNCSLAIIS